MLRQLAIAAIVVAQLALPQAVRGAPISWDGSASNQWNNSANWTGTGSVPAAADTVTIGTFPNINPISLNTSTLTSTTIQRLNIVTTSTVRITPTSTQTLTINPGAGNTGISVSGATGAHQIDAGIVLGSSQIWDIVNAPASLNVTGVISGAQSLTKNGAGTLTFSAANLYTGSTTINGGILQLGAANALPSMTGLTINTGATLAMSTFNSSVGSLAMTQGAITTGGGVLTLGGNVTTNAAGASSTIGSGLNLGGALRTFTIANGAAATDLNITGVVSGTGTSGIVKAGAGTLQLSNANTYAGTTAINAGTLQLGSNAALPSTTAVTIASGATLAMGTFNTSIAALSMTQGTVTGTGTLTLGGNVTTNNAAGASTIASNLDLGGATRTFTINNGSAATDLSVTGAISGSGSSGIIKAGAGTMVVSGANTYGGATAINAGFLQLGAANSLPTGTDVTIASGATLALNNFNQTIDSLTIAGAVTTGTGTLFLNGDVTGNAATTTATISGSGSGALSLNGSTRTFNIADGTNTPDLTISVGITGNGGIVKTGDGRLQLSAASNYTGDTTINGGRLQLAIDNALPSGTNVIISSGTLGLAGGVDQSIASLQMTAGTVTGTGILTVNGNITSNASATSSTIGGTLNLGGGNRTINVANGGAAFDLDISALIANGGIIKTGEGTLRLSGSAANTFTGDFVAQQGTVILDNDGPVNENLQGNLIVGNDVGGFAATVRNAQDGQVSNARGIRVNATGIYDVDVYLEEALLWDIRGGSVIGTTVSGTAGSIWIGNDGVFATGDKMGEISAQVDLRDAGADNVTATFEVENGAASTDLKVSGRIFDGTGSTTGIEKTGTGVLELSRDVGNVYGGPTTVSNGVLLVSNTSGSATGTGSIVVGGTATQGGTLAGTGIVAPTVSNTITVQAFGTISPGALDASGNSVTGTLTLGQSGDTVATTINGTYHWQIAGPDGAASYGTSSTSPLLAGESTVANQDRITSFGSLTFTNATIKVEDLMTGFDNTKYYSWTIASLTGGTASISGVGFDYSDFSALAPLGFFSLTTNLGATQVYLNYSPVPEPATWLMGLGAIAAGGWYVRRRRLRARAVRLAA